MNLNTVEEIERAIAALTPEQWEEPYVRLDEHYLHSGDVQLKRAIDPGPSITAFFAALPVIDDPPHFWATM